MNGKSMALKNGDPGLTGEASCMRHQQALSYSGETHGRSHNYDRQFQLLAFKQEVAGHVPPPSKHPENWSRAAQSAASSMKTRVHVKWNIGEQGELRVGQLVATAC